MVSMESERTPILQVRDLRFAYPDMPETLNAISFSVARGEKVAIAGPNGAGKTTLLLNLTGLLKGEGEVYVEGLRLEKGNFSAIRRILGLVFQSPDDQLFSTRVFDDVAYGLVYQGMEKAEIEERTRKALADVGMAAYESAVPHHLSLGQKKRVAIASVLCMQPEIILFDEPTMGLDARAKKQFLEIAASLTQTMLVATHDLRLAVALCERLLILDEGRLVFDGEMKKALRDREFLERHGLDWDV